MDKSQPDDRRRARKITTATAEMPRLSRSQPTHQPNAAPNWKRAAVICAMGIVICLEYSDKSVASHVERKKWVMFPRPVANHSKVVIADRPSVKRCLRSTPLFAVSFTTKRVVTSNVALGFVGAHRRGGDSATAVSR